MRWVLISTAVVAALGAHLSLRRLDPSAFEPGQPVSLGRLNGVNLAVHLGDVAVPNRLLPIPEEPSKFRLDSRLRFWDSYLITAPVPEVVGTERGATLQVPWTLLPASVVGTINQLDPMFSQQVEDWLQLKGSAAEWHFERLGQMAVPHESPYYLATGVRRIYAVNMFEFISELGDDYARNLTRAISSAVKEVVEESGRGGDQKLAFPALAAAEHVVDRYLVVSYSHSFEAILDGLSRAKNTPSEVVLVVWRAWSGTPELGSALRGLSQALYRKVPEWSERLKLVTSTAAGAGLLVGVVWAFVTTKKKRRSDWLTFVLGVTAVVPTVVSYWYLEAFLKVMPLSPWPAVEVSVLAVVCCAIGVLLQRKGVLAFGRRRTA